MRARNASNYLRARTLRDRTLRAVTYRPVRGRGYTDTLYWWPPETYFVTVIFLPDSTEYNPYQQNLADALDEDVVLGEGTRLLPILFAVRSAEDAPVIHFHWLDPYIYETSGPRTAVLLFLTVLQLVVVRLMGVPVVWTVHNVLSHESRYPRLERWFKHVFVRFGFCAHVFVHCENAADRLVEECALPERVRRRITVVPHGHYVDNYENEVSREEARRELGYDGNERVFLFFGQIKPYKGVVHLVETFASIDDPDYRLLIVGNPSDDATARELEARTDGDDRVRSVLRFVPDGDIQLYMNAADAVVLPYTEITTSGSAVLVMSFGRAVIVPRMGCVPELLDEEGALMYPPDADAGLRDALTEAKRRDLLSMGGHNVRRVRRYDWGTVAERTARVYAGVR